MDSAVSQDETLLAVSTGGKILIFDIETRELRQQLDGGGKVFFRPYGRAETGRDADADTVEGEEANKQTPKDPVYTLLSSAPTDERTAGTVEPGLILWDLDKNGRLLDEDEPLDAAAFAATAVESIQQQLTTQHEWSADFIASSGLYANFTAALRKAETLHQTQHNTIFPGVCIGGFGSDPFSADGRRLVMLGYGQTTQSDMRESDALPEAVVWDLEAGQELFRLHGHTDAIMWVGFSPDSAHIATVSWDGTMRMHDGTSGALSWATENSGQQCWAAAFSPDSVNIVWSSAGGRTVSVHNVSNGGRVAVFPREFNLWSRSLSWNPDGRSIALSTESTVYIWQPFHGLGDESITLEVKLQVDDNIIRGFAALDPVAWIDNGAKLAVGCSDGSVVVWDQQTNSKEAFLRPKGTLVGWSDSSFHFLGGKGYYVSCDGDDRVRFWRTSAPAFSSWWENKPV